MIRFKGVYWGGSFVRWDTYSEGPPGQGQPGHGALGGRAVSWFCARFAMPRVEQTPPRLTECSGSLAHSNAPFMAF